MTIRIKDLVKSDMKVDERTLLVHPETETVMGCKDGNKRAKTCTKCKLRNTVCC